MTRTLTAGTRTEPRAPRQPVDCADVVAGLWISVERMWLKAERYRKVVKAIRDTRAKLEDPRLRDHPKRPDAEARMEGWRLELGHQLGFSLRKEAARKYAEISTAEWYFDEERGHHRRVKEESEISHA